jgi:hypothetical protein
MGEEAVSEDVAVEEEAVHDLNLADGQRVGVNDEKKQELEAAFPGKYEFDEIEHDGTDSPVQGEATVAWSARRADDPTFHLPDQEPEPEAEAEPTDDDD